MTYLKSNIKKIQNIFFIKKNIQKKKKIRYHDSILLKQICFNFSRNNNIKNILQKNKKKYNKNNYKKNVFKKNKKKYNKNKLFKKINVNA